MNYHNDELRALFEDGVGGFVRAADDRLTLSNKKFTLSDLMEIINEDPYHRNQPYERLSILLDKLMFIFDVEAPFECKVNFARGFVQSFKPRWTAQMEGEQSDFDIEFTEYDLKIMINDFSILYQCNRRFRRSCFRLLWSLCNNINSGIVRRQMCFRALSHMFTEDTSRRTRLYDAMVETGRQWKAQMEDNLLPVIDRRFKRVVTNKTTSGNLFCRSDLELLDYSRHPLSTITSWFDKRKLHRNIRLYEEYRRVCRSLYLTRNYGMLISLGYYYDFIDVRGAKMEYKTTTKFDFRVIHNEYLNPDFVARLNVGKEMEAQMFSTITKFAEAPIKMQETLESIKDSVNFAANHAGGAFGNLGRASHAASELVNECRDAVSSIRDRINSFVDINQQAINKSCGVVDFFVDTGLLISSLVRNGIKSSYEIIAMYVWKYLTKTLFEVALMVLGRVNADFSYRAQMVPGDMLSSICSIATLVVMAIGCFIFKKRKDTELSVDAAIKLGEKVISWGDAFFVKSVPVFEKLKGFFDYCIDKAFEFFGFEPLSSAGRINKELGLFLQYAEHLKDMEKRINLISEPLALEELSKWQARGLMLNRAITTKHPQRNAFVLEYGYIERLYNDCIVNQPSPVRSRCRPTVICLYGEAGQGKSTLANTLADLLLQTYFKIDPSLLYDKQWRDENLHRLVYNYRSDNTGKDDFMNGFTNHHEIFIWSEPFQKLDSKMDPSNDVNSFMAMVDSAGWIVKQPFGTKGKINFKCSFVIITTNRKPPVHWDKDNWQSGYAINRRFDFVYEVKAKDAAKSASGALDLKKYHTIPDSLDITERFLDKLPGDTVALRPVSPADTRNIRYILEKAIDLQVYYKSTFLASESKPVPDYMNIVAGLSNKVPWDPAGYVSFKPVAKKKWFPQMTADYEDDTTEKIKKQADEMLKDLSDIHEAMKRRVEELNQDEKIKVDYKDLGEVHLECMPYEVACMTDVTNLCKRSRVKLIKAIYSVFTCLDSAMISLVFPSNFTSSVIKVFCNRRIDKVFIMYENYSGNSPFVEEHSFEDYMDRFDQYSKLRTPSFSIFVSASVASDGIFEGSAVSHLAFGVFDSIYSFTVPCGGSPIEGGDSYVNKLYKSVKDNIGILLGVLAIVGVIAGVGVGAYFYNKKKSDSLEISLEEDKIPSFEPMQIPQSLKTDDKVLKAPRSTVVSKVPQSLKTDDKVLKAPRHVVKPLTLNSAKVIHYSQGMNDSGPVRIRPCYEDWLEKFYGQIEVPVDKDSHSLRAKMILNTVVIGLVTPNNEVFKFVGCATFVHGRTAVMPKHYLPTLERVSWKVDFGDGVVEEVPGRRFAVFKLQSNSIISTCLDECIVIKHPGEDMDLCSLSFPCHLAMKSLLKHFMEDHDIQKFRSIPAILTVATPKDVGGKRVIIIKEYCTTKARAIERDVITYTVPDGTNKIMRVRTGYTYDLATQGGDCGGLLVAIEPTLQRKILGMHVCGNDVNGASVLLTKSIIMDLIPNLAQLESYDHPPYVTMDHFEDDVLFPTAHLERVDFTEDCCYIGSNSPYIGGCQIDGVSKYSHKHNSKSAIRTSVLQTEGHIPYETKKAPAVIHDYIVDGEVIRVRPKAFEKLHNDAIYVPQKILRKCAKDAFKYLYSQEDWFKWARILTIEEAVFGSEDPLFAGYIKSLNLNASAGKVLEQFTLPGLRGKHSFIDFDRKWIDPRVIKMVNDRIDQWQNLRRSQDVFSGELKDETRTIPKHLEARMYYSGDMISLIVMKMLFGGLAALIHKYWLVGGVTVGMDVHTQFHLLMKKLMEVSLKGFDGDFRKFDGRLPACLLECVFYEMIAFYDRAARYLAKDNSVRDEYYNARVTCSHSIRFAAVILDGLLVILNKSNPSGNFLTTEINSFCVKTGGRVIWDNIYDKTPFKSLKYYNDNVFEVANGDDNIFSVGEPFLFGVDRPKFNQTTVGEKFREIFDMEYTDAEKTGIPVPFRPIKECSFLKRKWIYTDKEYGCLDMDSIREIPLWYKRGASSHENFDMSFRSCLQELFYWGETIYTEYASLYEECFRGTEFARWNIASYDEMLNAYLCKEDMHFVL